MIFVFLGKSAAGKDKIFKKILENEEFKNLNIKKLNGITSRPIRQNEKNGEEYTFKSKEEFEKDIKLDKFIEYTKFNTINKNGVKDYWYYGTYKIDNKDDYIKIVNPGAFYQIKSRLDNVISFYITCSNKERLIRALNREDDPNIDEILRRYNSDEIDFKGIEKDVDFIVENNDLDEATNFILNKIKHLKGV